MDDDGGLSYYDVQAGISRADDTLDSYSAVVYGKSAAEVECLARTKLIEIDEGDTILWVAAWLTNGETPTYKPHTLH